MPEGPRAEGNVDQPADRRRGVIVSLPEEIRDLMRDRSNESRITYTNLALDAVEAKADELPTFYESQAPTQRPGRIFARTAYHNQRGSRREDEVTINLQLLNSDINILDEMWKQAGAPSRSHYLATALSLYLRPPSKGGAP